MAPPSFFFILTIIEQLECFLVATCPNTYTKTIAQRIFVVPAYFPIFSYLFIVILTFYERTVFNVVLSAGTLFNGLFITAVSQALSNSITVVDTGCRTSTYGRPTEETSVLWFIVFFVAIYEWKMNDYRRLFCYRSWVIIQLVIVAALAAIAQVQLHIYHPAQVFAGVLVGLVTAAVSAGVLHGIVIPHIALPALRKVLKLLCIEDRHPRYVINEALWPNIVDGLQKGVNKTLAFAVADEEDSGGSTAKSAAPRQQQQQSQKPTTRSDTRRARVTRQGME